MCGAAEHIKLRAQENTGSTVICKIWIKKIDNSGKTTSVLGDFSLQIQR